MILSAALALLLVQGVGPAPADDRTDASALVGCWEMEVDLPIGTRQGKLCFVQQEGKPMSALMRVRKKWTVAKSVKARPGHVELVVEAPVGEAVITASFSKKKMNGHFNAKVGRRPFKAKKLPD